MITEWGTFTFHPSQREQFRQGGLMRQWAAAYPEIFDLVDISTAANQKDYHFYEWFAAIAFKERLGYLSLVEKYQFKRHPLMRSILQNLVPLAVYDLVTEHRQQFGGFQVPDLLVYKPDLSDWFFCEVKGPHDRLRPVQVDFFEALSSASGRPVYYVRVLESPPASAA